MLDLVIRGAQVIDGKGSAAQTCDVGVKGDIIACVGGCPQVALREIDGKGLHLCPGFIDMHSHADLFYAFPSDSQPKLMQGVTTEVVGNCGLGVWPLREKDREFLRRHLAGVLGSYPDPWPWEDCAGWARHLEQQGLPVNVVPLAAHSALRLYAMGISAEPAGKEALLSMERALDEAFDQGAWGFSTGLIYPPACYAASGEIVALCKGAVRRGGYMAIHIRSEGDYLLESIDEAIAFARASGVPLEISHLKAYGRTNWHKVEEVLERIYGARRSGIDVSFDSYPYTLGSTTLTALLPPWVFEGGLSPERLRDRDIRNRIEEDITGGVPGWESYIRQSGWGGIIFSSGVTQKNLPLEGKSLEAIGEELGLEPVDALLSILGDEGAQASMLIAGMAEEGVRTILLDGLQLLGSDGLYGRKPHPRVYGAFPRVLGKFVREERAITAEEAVRKMTGAPAQRLGLRDRGVIAEGMKADLVLLDLDKVGDEATYDEPFLYPTGIACVVVNGAEAVEDGKIRLTSAGRVLKKR
jgi:N-acyl-D-amino-acid deacylase